MTTDLWCLVASALWGLVLVLVEINGKTRIAGSAWNLSNRDKEQTFPPWIVRTSLALSNHKENFPLFLTAILVVHLAGRADRVSAIAAVVFVVARAAHGLLYIGGVKGVRTVAFIAAFLANLVVFSKLVV